MYWNFMINSRIKSVFKERLQVQKLSCKNVASRIIAVSVVRDKSHNRFSPNPFGVKVLYIMDAKNTSNIVTI